MKRTRRNHGATFKAQVAVAAVKGDKTLAELAEQFSVHPTQITEGKQQLLARGKRKGDRLLFKWSQRLFESSLLPFPFWILLRRFNSFCLAWSFSPRHDALPF